MAACGFGNDGCDPCGNPGPVDPDFGVNPQPGYGVDPDFGVDPQPGYGGAAPLPAPVPSYGGAAPLPAPVPSPNYGAQPLRQYNAVVDEGYGQQPHIPDMPNPMPQPHIPDMPNPFSPPDDCEDCGELVRTTKKVSVPCTRNTYRSVQVKVPRQVTEKVARQVQYVDYENQQKTVNYTVNTQETRYKDVQQNYQEPVTKTKTRMVNVTKKVPKTIYVDVTVQQPQTFTVVENECRTRTVKIPYQVTVPQQRTKIENVRVPVNKTKTVYEDQTKTIFETQTKQECHPVTTMVTKVIPVYHWKPNSPEPCNDGGGDCQPCQTVEPIMPMPTPLPEPMPMPTPLPQPVQPDYLTERRKVTYEAPASFDADGNGVLDENERAAAAAQGKLKKFDAQGNLLTDTLDSTDDEFDAAAGARASMNSAQGAAQGAMGSAQGAAQGAMGSAQGAMSSAQGAMASGVGAMAAAPGNAAGMAKKSVRKVRKKRSGSSSSRKSRRRKSSRRKSSRKY